MGGEHSWLDIYNNASLGKARFYLGTCEMADTDTGILIWWGV